MFLVLKIFNEGAYLTFKSIFHKALNLFSSIVKSRSNMFLDGARDPVQPTAPMCI